MVNYDEEHCGIVSLDATNFSGNMSHSMSIIMKMISMCTKLLSKDMVITQAEVNLMFRSKNDPPGEETLNGINDKDLVLNTDEYDIDRLTGFTDLNGDENTDIKALYELLEEQVKRENFMFEDDFREFKTAFFYLFKKAFKNELDAIKEELESKFYIDVNFNNIKDEVNDYDGTDISNIMSIRHLRYEVRSIKLTEGYEYQIQRKYYNNSN